MEKLQAYNNPHSQKYDSVDVFRQKALDLGGRQTVFYFVSFAVSC